MQRLPFAMLAVLVIATGSRADEPPMKLAIALKGFDPVELVAGKEVAGDSKLTVQRGTFHYSFATEANLKLFERDPERFSAQFGGACLKMGPLAGSGHPDRFYVFDRRIYIFASESCRDAFKADPRRFIDIADEQPKGTADDVKKGENLLRTAVKGCGGEEILKKLETYQVQYQFTLKRGDAEVKYSRISATTFPNTYVQMDDFGAYKAGWLLHPKDGYLSWGRGQPVDESVRQYMDREFYRHPIHVLKAWQDGEVKAVYLDSDKIGEVLVDRVAVYVKGATTKFSIDAVSGRIIRVGYRGRAGAGIADVERDYSAFREVKGLVVPFQVSTRFDGKPFDNPKVVVASIQVNENIEPELLQKPK